MVNLFGATNEVENMFNEELGLKDKIKWAMVGGGRGSQIGASHRTAAARSGMFELVAGVFDIDKVRSTDFGVNIGVSNERIYDDYLALLAEESKKSDGIKVISIVTPNATHFEIAKAALEAGIHVICEKPITFTVAQSLELQALVNKNNLIFGVMYGYSGYPMIHQAKAMINKGLIGQVRVINMQFAHGFHNIAHEIANPSLQWRVHPDVAGPTYVLGDLATHTFYLAELITGMLPQKLLCARQSFIKTRAPLEDNAHVLLQYENGAVGTVWASAINAGSTHQQKIRIVGELASLEWWDEYPNQLRYEVQGQPVQILERGMPYLEHNEEGVSDDFIGSGHPEGYFESWTNLYQRFGRVISNRLDGVKSTMPIWYPNIVSGINGVKFCEKCVESAEKGSTWVDF